MTFILDALAQALVEFGPHSPVYLAIEKMYATGQADFVDYDQLVKDLSPA